MLTRRIALALAPLALFPALAAAQEAPLPGTPAPKLAHVAMETELGTIMLALDEGRAPVTAGNFLRYVDQKRFDGITFYRVMRLDWGKQPAGLIQAGTRGDPKRELAPIAHEPTDKTGIRHDTGAISMARWAPGTAKGDFSIMVSPMHGLDADPAAADAEARAGFAAFGHVVAGMDVVRAIYDVPLSATEGVGVMKGQIIEKPVRVLRIRRIAAPPPQASAAAPTQ